MGGRRTRTRTCPAACNVQRAPNRCPRRPRDPDQERTELVVVCSSACITGTRGIRASMSLSVPPTLGTYVLVHYLHASRISKPQTRD
ncbi:hypothetical protein L227DRAFT_428843 [Lentinus tigrinus ALCF2SS1-6]|uniref:Uncharacterized protein n=1 Tax=Lentinus tigrinus ALCF2SS1-6 TaxID=1328759 RepID=A0A5C2SFM3_9APHY|nr:hypothetical protein L227DRAFT_428843 [Lentinus tigrinus ALCF2SS1-6]